MIATESGKRKSTCSQDVIDGAVAWAIAIAKDNSFHYGLKPYSQKQGCYFCGTYKGRKSKKIVDREKSYCCNPFVHAAFAHGGGEPTMLKLCRKGKSFGFSKGNGYSTSKLFKNLGHPDKSKLKKGDVLCRGTNKGGHVVLYIGDGKIVHAHGGDDNKRNSKKWNGSISISTLNNYSRYPRVHRYIGNGGGTMELPSNAKLVRSGSSDESGGVDDGSGINLQQSISKLYHSNNYEYLTAREETQTDQLVSTLSNKITNLLNNVNFEFPEAPESTAFPEPLITSTVELSEFEEQKPKRVIQGKSTQLLSYPTLVEAPTIVLDFNGTKIGGYGNTGDKYPNYITSMTINKTNGRINQYNINLSYQVRFGEDPNFIDKLISKTGYTNPLKILYGDSNYPSGYYKEESAVIMDVRQSEDTSAYRINYSISAISSVGAAHASLTTFSSVVDKPSNIIYKLLYDSGNISKSLIELFPGMRNRTQVASKNIIPTNDEIVKIGGMSNVSPLKYLSYLVACMNNSTNNSSYYLNLVDNSYSDLNGAYFEIKEVINYGNSTNTDIDSNYFELDIGYPSNNFITNFQICNDNYWSLVFDYAGTIPKFEYGIDDNGDLIENKTNALYTVDRYSESSIVSSNWWKNVTEFPISAKVTLKGLINPAILMSYIKINALFYGQRDMASGLYVVTAQNDSISGSGYSTELTLLRVLGE